MVPRSQRLQALVDYLANKPGPTAVSDLARALSVSIRTVHADLAYLKGQGVPVRATAGRKGGVWLATPSRDSGSQWAYDVPARPPLKNARPREPFVGYQSELAEIISSAQTAHRGGGQVFLVVGEPGIGKTRLLEEVALRCTAAGHLVLWGACPETEGAPPYWPWTQVLRGLYRSLGHEALARLEDVDHGLVALVAPEYATLAEGAMPPAPGNPGADRFRLFETISRLLRAASARSPITILLDDLHLADDASLALLAYVAGEIGAASLLMVGAARDVAVGAGTPVPAVLPVLARLPYFRLRRLEGLDRQDTGRLMESLAPGAPTSLADTIYHLTDGNPFFIREIVRSFVEGSLQPGGTPVGEMVPLIPGTVRGVIEKRLHGLSDTCLRVLQSAAILGRQFDLDRLRLLTGDVSSSRRLQALDEAMKAHVVERHGAPRTYQFSHALIQQVLYDSLSLDQRAQAHAHAAIALEGMYGRQAGEHASELTYHFEQAQDVLGTEKVAVYASLAGQQAQASYAWETAAAHFQRAIAARRYEAADTLLGDLYFGLGRAQAALLQSQAALESLNRAFDIYASLGAIQKAAAVGAAPVPALPGTLPRQADLPARGLALPQLTPAAKGWLLVSHAHALGFQTFAFDQAEAAANEALQIANSTGDAHLRAEALLALVHSYVERLELQQVLPRWLQVLELRDRLHAPFTEALAHQWAAVAYVCAGKPQEAGYQFEAALAIADRTADRHHWQWSMWLSGLALLLEGRWDEALRRAHLAEGLHGMLVEPAMQAVVEYRTGDLGKALALCRRSMELDATPDRRQTWPASVLVDIGRLMGDLRAVEEAKRLALVLLDRPRLPPADVLPAQAILAAAALAEGDRATMERLYLQLLPRGSDFTLSFFFLAGCMGRWLGLLAGALGRRDEAIQHFQRTIASCRAAGFGPELAWTCHDYAELLSMHRGAVQRQQAMLLLDEGAAIATKLGMKPLVDRIAALREKLAGQAHGRTRYPAGLTEREVEVLRLIAAGRSNPQIAQELVLSANTVADHVRNILIKTNTANRAEAAAYATRQGLLDSPDSSKSKKPSGQGMPPRRRLGSVCSRIF